MRMKFSSPTELPKEAKVKMRTKFSSPTELPMEAKVKMRMKFSSPVKSQKSEKQYLLVVTENGYGKRTDLKEYRLQKRGGTGIKTAKIIQKTGNLISSKVLTALREQAPEDLIVISQKGQVIRIKISQISRLSRATQGVRIMKLEAGDKVASATCI